jgi:two-component system response regulator AtoC
MEDAFYSIIATSDPICRRLNILAVDDEAGTRKALDIVLKLAGYRPITAKDPEEALRLFEKGTLMPDLVITNHNMPGMNGLAFVRKLKDRGYSGKIIVLTAYAGSEEEREYRKLGVAGLMEKPFNVAELRNWIACIQQCHSKDFPPGQKPPCPPGSDEFCWWRPE